MSDVGSPESRPGVVVDVVGEHIHVTDCDSARCCCYRAGVEAGHQQVLALLKKNIRTYLAAEGFKTSRSRP